MSRADDVLFDVAVWQPAIGKFAAATHLTVSIYGGGARRACGPVFPTPLFDLFHQYGFEPGLFVDCARACLEQTGERPAVVLAPAYGLAVVGTSLAMDGRIVGAAVAGYALLDFCQRSEIERLAHVAGIPFKDAWEVARLHQPVPERRLLLHGELLQVLVDSLLREIDRKQHDEQMMRGLNQELEQRVADRTAEAMQLVRRLAIAQEEERSRIARDLHDHLGQQITALRLSLAVCKEHAGQDDPQQLHLARAESVASHLDADIEFLAWELRPTPLEKGLVEAIDAYVEKWSRHFGVPIDVLTSGLGSGRLPSPVELSLYRIAQEALNNVAKHAAATRVAVILERRDERVVLVVEDNGRGFDVDTSADLEQHRLGVTGMRERAALASGTLDLESAPGKGTSVIVKIPLRVAPP